MRFIETPVFTRRLLELLSDDEYRPLQLALLFRPEQGDLIRGTGGLRKIRWKARGTGKRGGCRVIYYWDKKDDTIYLLLIFAKGKQEDLTPEQVKSLRRLVLEELK